MIKKCLLIFSSIMFFFFLSFFGCSKNNKEKIGELDPPEILYEDQVELNIEDKYFTVQIDSMFNTIIPHYRFDIIGQQLVRYWLRYYNNMWEVRFYNQEFFEKNENGGYNYLFGIKYDKAFYLRWRNEPEKRSPMAYTSDIGKYTVKLQTNLPKDIVKHYYPV